MKNGIPRLIECENGQWSPFTILCRHLIDKPQQHWIAIPVDDPDRETLNDYICEKCAGRQSHKLAKYLQVVCDHCCKELRKQRVKHKEDEEDDC